MTALLLRRPALPARASPTATRHARPAAAASRAAGGRKPPRHFPAARFFFHALETGLTAGGSWRDALTGSDQTPASNGVGSIGCPYPGTVEPDANGQLYPAAWRDFGRASPLQLAVVKVTSATPRLPLGDGYHINGSDLSVSWGGTLHVLMRTYVDGVQTGLSVPNAADPRLTIGGVYALAVWYNRETATVGLRVLEDTGAGYVTAIDWQPPDALAVDTFRPDPVTRCEGLAFYGWAGFAFAAGLPDNIDAAMAWALANWQAKRMFLPPMWKAAR